MTESELKKKAKGFYVDRNYLEAFLTLNQLPVRGFISFAEKQVGSGHGWLTNTDSSEVFWNNFLTRHEACTKFFSSDKANHLLHLYFTQLKTVYPSFLKCLAKAYPELLVNSIRLNSAYLVEKHYETFDFFPESGTELLRLNHNVFDLLRKAEKDLWLKVEEWSNCLEGYVLNSALFETTLWLEISYFNTRFNHYSIHHLASVYNMFIELLAHKRGDKINALSKHFNEEALDKKFIELFMGGDSRKLKSIENKPLFSLLNAISDWIDFKEGILSSYSHDLDYQPHSSPLGLELNSNAASYYRWKLDGERYFLTHQYYVMAAAMHVVNAEAMGKLKIPKGKTPEDHEINRHLSVNNHAVDFLMDDLCIEHFEYEGKKIEAPKLFRMLQTLSSNRNNRIELAKLKYFENSNSWYEMYEQIFNEMMMTRIRREPYLCSTIKDFIEHSERAMNNIKYEEN